MKEWLYRGMLGFGEAMIENPDLLGVLITFLFIWCIVNTAISGINGDKIKDIRFMLRLNGIRDYKGKK